MKPTGSAEVVHRSVSSGSAPSGRGVLSRLGGRSASVFVGLGSVALAVLALGRVAGPVATGAVVVVAASAGIVVARVSYRKDVLQRGTTFDVSIGRPSFRQLVVSIRRADVILVAAFLGLSAAGVYGAAVAVTLIVPMAAAVVGSAMLKLLRRRDVRGTRDAAGGMVRLLSLVSVPITVAMVVFAPDIVRAVYGREYGQAIVALQVLAVAFPLSLANRTLSTVSVAAGHAPLQGRCIAAALGVAFAADLVLIPSVGVAGAAWGTVVFEAAQVALLLLGLARAHIAPNVGRELAPALVAGGMLLGSLASFGRGPAGLVAGSLGVAAVALWALDRGLVIRLEKVSAR
jgi:O-antigen/teichoic acid export membrane protein